ncbi:MAG: M28 family peptidase [Anaerolineae bacterium]|nr:M28 family peptidase [Anaerolineae bacterium]
MTRPSTSDDSLHDTLMGHVYALSLEIGPRPLGSPENEQAAEYVEALMHEAGLEVESQEYACTGWTHRATWAEVDGDALDSVAANVFSPPCDVRGPVIAVRSLAELEAADLRGRIVILHGELTRAPLSPKAWFLKDERDDRIITALETKEPAAILTVQTAGMALMRLIEDADFDAPSATVPARIGMELLRRQPREIRLVIEAARRPAVARNVVGRRPGDTGSDSKIVLCAHFDTKIETPGAFDNASGVAVMLTLAEWLADRGLAHGLECVAFNGEEYLPMGDDEYLRRGEDDFGNIVAAINCDGVGQLISANSIAQYGVSAAFGELLRDVTADFPGLVWVEPWPESNHSTFAFRGVPAVAFSSATNQLLAHQQYDTAEWIDASRLAEVVHVTERLIEALQDKSPAWTRAEG